MSLDTHKFLVPAMENEWVSNLEKELERVQAQATETQSKLDQITNILSQLVATKSEPP